MRSRAFARELDPDGTGLRPAGFTDRPDTWWASTCYALALLVELHRNPMIKNSPLFQLPPGAGAADLRALAGPPVVADLIAMRDLAQQRLLPQLPAEPVHAGPEFDGSRLVPADADLIVGDTLLDFKADQGGNPRLDGSRSAVLHPGLGPAHTYRCEPGEDGYGSECRPADDAGDADSSGRRGGDGTHCCRQRQCRADPQQDDSRSDGCGTREWCCWLCWPDRWWGGGVRRLSLAAGLAGLRADRWRDR
ncbi:hypothetical protein KZZ52_42095 [Dactylosporangium sp. AC04546]|uniref:hypothetical protein n=1 Tax=Dactylosporangium sp. AC04546 TaxID=2862460 RepID=UPI001EDD92C2|nr:hypothetical protein [Dactylosporangium sp. AC04546]WVK80515.1 hypothetical protein KZZ52_42095 [Dactylosporangium sp. AC04546]